MTRIDRIQRQRMDPATRQSDILQAAERAFAAHPYESVSVAGIAGQVAASEALVYRYFGSKAGLYVEVLRRGSARLAAAQQAAVESLPADSSDRDRVGATVDCRLDLVAAADGELLVIMPGNEPIEAVRARAELRAAEISFLRATAGLTDADDYLLHGHLGFLEAAARHWAAQGCPPAVRGRLRQLVLAALFDALSADGPAGGATRLP